MTIADARSIAAGSILHTDVCVVGSGAAGITIAHQLRHSGLNVLVLGAGEFKVQPDHKVPSWSIEEVGRPLRHHEPSRGRGFGGSTEYWFRRIAAPDPIDLEQRPWVAHSGWLIGLEDLDPWNLVAAGILGVAHLERLDIDRWERSPTVRLFRRPGESGLGVFLWCDVQNAAVRLRSMMKNSETITVLLTASACELIPSERSETVDSLIVRSSSDATYTVRAGAYLLATGGLENPRLMLASNSRSDARLGNEHDLVGRFFMDHPRGEGIARLDLPNAARDPVEMVRLPGEKADSDIGHEQLRDTFDPELQRGEELLNHSMLAHFVTRGAREPGFPFGEAASGEPRSDSNRREYGAEAFSTARQTCSHPEVWSEPTICSPLRESDEQAQIRSAESWSIISAEMRPGFPCSDSIGESVNRRSGRAVDGRDVRDILRKAGLNHFDSEVLVASDIETELWDMMHLSGTTRMADRPEHGVVDRHCRVHGVDNLYVAGSSVFPSVGHFKSNADDRRVGCSSRLPHSQPDRLVVNVAERVVGGIDKLDFRTIVWSGGSRPTIARSSTIPLEEDEIGSSSRLF